MMEYTDSSHRGLIQKYYQPVEMPGGWSFNQPEMLRLIDLYYNSRYKTGRYDSQGFRKFFYNIVKPACDIATKFIDLDTRDITLYPEMAGDELRIFLMQRRLKQWLKDEEFGVLLNRITFFLPIYGHVVIKRHKDGWDIVPIQNLRHNPSAKGIITGCFSEIYSMNPQQLSEMKAWDTKELFDRGETDEYIVYDCYDLTSKGWHRTVKGDLWCYKKDGAIVRGVESEINHQQTDFIASITLYEEDIDEPPYREIKWEEVPGRALGRGFVEYLEDNQVARNETENLERKGIAVHSLGLWQTRDDTIAGQNVLVNAKNGDIVKVESEITPIAMEERNLPQYQESRQNWDLNTERKTFTSDITTGASLPSRTPLGVANLQASLASSFFERKREELGLFIKCLLLEDIIPSFAKDTRKEHTLTFYTSDPEVSWLDDAITEAIVGEQVIKYSEQTGWFPSKEQKELIRMQVKDKLKGRKNRFLKIPAGYWENAHYYVDINITGESTDVSARSQLIQMILQIVGTNPAVLQNPSTRAMIFSLASMGGINPTELNLTTSSDPTPPPQVAGSIATPSPSAVPSVQPV